MKKKDTEKPIEIDKEKEKPKENHEDSSENKVKELHEGIEKIQKEKDEIFAQLQRVSADYTNFQKRIPRQISESVNYEKERIIKSLLGILDNFERTLQNVDKSDNIEVLAKGVQIIYNQILDILKSHGVEQMKTSGQKFDPSMHEAIMRKADSDKEDNIVLEEFQKGYKINDRVIRPSKVLVNKLPTEQPAAEQEQNGQDKAVEEPETTDTE